MGHSSVTELVLTVEAVETQVNWSKTNAMEIISSRWCFPITINMDN